MKSFSFLASWTLAICLSLLPVTAGNGKGKGGGKPGGGDPPTPADPAIVLKAEGNFGRGDLMVMDADGSNQTIILEGAKRIAHSSPAWSPDGEWIVFSGSSSLYAGEGLYVIRKDGSQLLFVAPGPGGNPAWSPDGHWIAYTDNFEGDDLWLVEVNGLGEDPDLSFGVPKQITFTDDWEWNPTWSPESGRVAVEYRVPGNDLDYSDIVIYDIESVDSNLCLTQGDSVPCISGETNVRDLQPNLPLALWYPSWAKTHQNWIAVSAFDIWPFDIWFIDITGSCPPVNLTSDSGTNHLHPNWSSDDSQLVLGTGGGVDILTMGVFDNGQCVTEADAPQLIASDGKGIFGLWDPVWSR